MLIENGQVGHIRWKDQAFVLIMSSFISGDERVIRTRKKPKETSSKAKPARAPLTDDEATKELSIALIADQYNYKMGAVDQFDHLTSRNAGLRQVRHRGHQVLEH